ncbi:MAG: DUF3822 family protein [Flavobacteriales bacterium]|nr:DUF3822 family protein [Flavobacteriales bacterium]
METGNKVLPSPLFKEKIHLKADNEQETVQSGLLSFVDISRFEIQILKRNKAFKVIEFINLQFPLSTENGVWSNRINEILESSIFKNHVEGTEVIYSVSEHNVALVPSSLYADQEAINNFEFLFGDSKSLLVLNQKLINSDTTGIFCVPVALSELSSKPIQSSYFNWLDGLADSSKAKAHLVVLEKEFALAIFKEGKLVLSNWFNFESPADVLYYLMASLETLKILHSEVEVVLGGAIDKGDEVHSGIGKFISKLSFAKRPKNLTYSYSFKDVSEHRYPFIFAAACA